MTIVTEVHLLRHAHSSRAVAGERDHRRGLDARGEREAAMVRSRWATNTPRIARIHCSTAQRARLTLAPLLPLLADAALLYEDGLYALGPEAYAAALRGGDPADPVLLVGHNPTIEEVLHAWCPDDRSRLSGGMGTAFQATVHLPRAADGGFLSGRLVQLIAPG